MGRQHNITHQRSNEQLTPQTSSRTYCLNNPIENLKNTVTKRYGEKGIKYLNTYNADFLSRNKLKIKDCYFGEYHTLAELKTLFDDKFPTAWLVAQLHDLSEYCGCKEKLSGNPLRQCADIIASEFFYLKTTELMLFFRKFKSGSFGVFYGTIDPLVIMSALRTFLKERNNAYDKKRMEDEAEERKNREKNAISWAEYCRRFKHEILNPLEPTKRIQTEEDAEMSARMISELRLNDNIKDTYIKAFTYKYGCTPEEYLKNKTHEK